MDGDEMARRGRTRAALALSAFLALVAASASAACARWIWFGELLVNVRWYLGLFAVATALALAWARRPWSAAAAVVLAALHLGPSLVLWAPAAPAPVGAADERLVVATANLAFFNRSAARVHAFLVDADADVVALQEIDPFWSEQIDRWRHLYPHQIVRLPRIDPAPPDTFGIALIARRRFAEHRVGGERLGTPWIVARVEAFGADAAPIQVVVAHPTRPGAAHRIARRDRQIRALAADVAWDERTLLLADLNATRYAPIWDELVESTGLRDARRGFGRLPTWRASIGPLFAWLALDQILVGDAFVVEDCRVGPDLKSDHRPLLATLRVASGERDTGAR